MGRFIINIRLKKVVLLVLIMLLVACSSMSVTRDWDPNFDFSQFQTFAILENDQDVNRLIDQRIVDSIVATLTAKGFKQVDTPETANLVIGYQMVTESRRSYQTVHASWDRRGFRSPRSHWGGHMGTARTTVFHYTVGTLVIAAFESSNKDLVWEGSASSTAIDSATGAEQRNKLINDAVQKILKDFPPGVKPAN